MQVPSRALSKSEWARVIWHSPRVVCVVKRREPRHARDSAFRAQREGFRMITETSTTVELPGVPGYKECHGTRLRRFSPRTGASRLPCSWAGSRGVLEQHREKTYANWWLVERLCQYKRKQTHPPTREVRQGAVVPVADWALV